MGSTVWVAPRRRILLGVEPRILSDSLATVLDHVGVDDVLLYADQRADRSAVAYDAAILSVPHDAVMADLVIEVDDDTSVGHVVSGEHSEDVPVRTPLQLLSLLDRLCPASTDRIALVHRSS